MRTLIIIWCVLFASIGVHAQTPVKTISIPDAAKPMIIAEASCGQCQFGMKAKGCDLAVRLAGKSYFVDGTSIDDHGDAHGKEGFCEAVRNVEFQGELVNGRYRVTYFKVLPLKKAE